MSLLFATPGTPLSTPSPGGTLAGLHRAAELGIRAMEIEWVQRVPGNTAHMEEIGRTARTLDIALTVHAPYYVNLNSDEPHKREASMERITAALSMAQIAGAVSVCVHAAFYGKHDPSVALQSVREATEHILANRSAQFPDVNLAYETMGKPSQFGTLEEVLRISKEFDLYPCVDIAHLHARSRGNCNDKDAWNEVFDTYQQVLGTDALTRMHLHFSGIQYGEKGERHHLPLEESDARWHALCALLRRRKIGGILVCESPLQEQDTMRMMQAYSDAS